MRIYRCEDYRDMSLRVANVIAAQLTLKPDCVLGLATGSTPVGAYEELAARARRGELSFREAASVNLDEYLGLGGDHPQSYRYFMDQHLFRQVDIRMERTFLPDGTAEDPWRECARYDALIEELGGVDLQLLGMGRNGHIGFNEPGDCFLPDTHVVDLAPGTIRANSRFFASEAEVPRKALTMGVRGIFHARRILLAVSGEDKAEALAKALTGPVTPQVPASVLQLHPDVILAADLAALRELRGVALC